MINKEIRDELFRLQDTKYRDFQVKLIPGKTADDMIGVRTPYLRKYAKQLAKRQDVNEFLNTLPHQYFDEDQLHAFILCEMKDYDQCIEKVSAFLPYVDNWATCDQMSPKIFKKHKDELLIKIEEWISLKETYTVRFGIGMLMEHFLDEEAASTFL